MSNLSTFTKTCCGLFLAASSTASFAEQYDMSQHVEFSYNTECHQGFCLNQTIYTFEPRDPYAALNQETFGEDGPKLNLDAETTPKYLYVSQEKDWQYLKEQTYTILGLSVATVGLMTLLPESITKWDDEDRDLSNLGSKWKDNVH